MISKDTSTQENLIDGTVYVFEPHENGAYVTVAGRDGQVYILGFDAQDLRHLRTALEAVYAFDLTRSSEDQTRVTPIGVERIAEMLKGGDHQ